ncbi:MAG: hypothetical protein R2800_15180 [Flavipsychrobacter sp.]
MRSVYTIPLIVFVLLSSIKVYAQETKQKVIVIDTIEREPMPRDVHHKAVSHIRELFPYYNHCNLISIYCKPFFFDCLEEEYIQCVSKLNENGHQSLIAIVKQIPGIEYISVSISFDNKSSSLELLNIDQVKEDTIRINKWKLYKNRLVDTTYGGRVYSKMENDSMVFQAYKVERIFKYDDFKPDTLKQIQVCINTIKYILPLTIEKGDVVYTTFRGAEEPMRVYKKYRNYLDKHDNKEPVKKYKYDISWGDYTTTQYIYSATIDFATTAP